MSNFHFNGAPTPDADLAAKRAEFLALPADQQAQVIANFEKLRATAAAVRAHRVQIQAARAIDAARTSSSPQ